MIAVKGKGKEEKGLWVAGSLLSSSAAHLYKSMA